MNFEYHTIQRFKLGVDYHLRIFQVYESKSGLISVKNVLTGEFLIRNVMKSEIQVNGQPLENADDLQEIVYNQKCVCENEPEDGDYKIFDLTFDYTFE